MQRRAAGHRFDAGFSRLHEGGRSAESSDIDLRPTLWLCFKQPLYSVNAEDGGVLGRRFQPTERDLNVRGTDGSETFAAHPRHDFRQHRTGGNGCHAPPHLIPNRRHHSILESQRQPHNVATSRIGDLDAHNIDAGIEFPHISGILKMLKQSRAVHR